MEAEENVATGYPSSSAIAAAARSRAAAHAAAQCADEASLSAAGAAAIAGQLTVTKCAADVAERNAEGATASYHKSMSEASAARDAAYTASKELTAAAAERGVAVFSIYLSLLSCCVIPAIAYFSTFVYQRHGDTDWYGVMQSFPDMMDPVVFYIQCVPSLVSIVCACAIWKWFYHPQAPATNRTMIPFWRDACIVAAFAIAFFIDVLVMMSSDFCSIDKRSSICNSSDDYGRFLWFPLFKLIGVTSQLFGMYITFENCSYVREVIRSHLLTAVWVALVCVVPIGISLFYSDFADESNNSVVTAMIRLGASLLFIIHCSFGKMFYQMLCGPLGDIPINNNANGDRREWIARQSPIIALVINQIVVPTSITLKGGSDHEATAMFFVAAAVLVCTFVPLMMRSSDVSAELHSSTVLVGATFFCHAAALLWGAATGGLRNCADLLCRFCVCIVLIRFGLSTIHNDSEKHRLIALIAALYVGVVTIARGFLDDLGASSVSVGNVLISLSANFLVSQILGLYLARYLVAHNAAVAPGGAAPPTGPPPTGPKSLLALFECAIMITCSSVLLAVAPFFTDDVSLEFVPHHGDTPSERFFSVNIGFMAMFVVCIACAYLCHRNGADIGQHKYVVFALCSASLGRIVAGLWELMHIEADIGFPESAWFFASAWLIRGVGPPVAGVYVWSLRESDLKNNRRWTNTLFVLQLVQFLATLARLYPQRNQPLSVGIRVMHLVDIANQFHVTALATSVVHILSQNRVAVMAFQPNTTQRVKLACVANVMILCFLVGLGFRAVSMSPWNESGDALIDGIGNNRMGNSRVDPSNLYPQFVEEQSVATQVQLAAALCYALVWFALLKIFVQPQPFRQVLPTLWRSTRAPSCLLCILIFAISEITLCTWGNVGWFLVATLVTSYFLAVVGWITLAHWVASMDPADRSSIRLAICIPVFLQHLYFALMVLLTVFVLCTRYDATRVWICQHLSAFSALLVHMLLKDISVKAFREAHNDQ